MRVAIFGGTGFVGSYLVDALVSAGHEPVLLVRPGSEAKVRHADRCLLVPGVIEDDRAIASTLENCAAAIYLIGILKEHPAKGITFRALQYEGARRAIDGARTQQVERFLLMSANGARADGTPYQSTKYEAETYLARSGLSQTVFRPSIIFGDPRGRREFCTQLRDDMIAPPIPAPAFFSGWSPSRGTFSMTPVHVEDVAAAFLCALERDDTAGEILTLGGAKTLSWPEIIQTIGAACGRRKVILPVPVLPVRLAATFLDRFDFFPLTRDQLTMLMEGNTVQSHADFERLAIGPRSLSVNELAYLRAA